MLHARQSHSSLFLITRTILGEQYRSLSSSLCNFLHSLITSSLLGPNILLSTLLSNTLTLRFFLSLSNQVSHPYTTAGKVGPCHHGMARPQVADGGRPAIWRVAANILNKQPRTVDKGWSSSLRVGRGANNCSL